MCDSVTTKHPPWTRLDGLCWSLSVTSPVVIGLQLYVDRSMFILRMNNICSSDVSLWWRITTARCVSIWCLLISQWIIKLYWIRYWYQYCTLVLVCWNWSQLVSVYVAQTPMFTGLADLVAYCTAMWHFHTISYDGAIRTDLTTVENTASLKWCAWIRTQVTNCISIDKYCICGACKTAFFFQHSCY